MKIRFIKGDTIQSCLIVLFSLFCFTPLLKNNYFLSLCIIGVLFFITTINAFLLSLTTNKMVLLSFLYLVVEVLYKVLGISTALWGNYANRFILFAAVWMGVYSIENITNESKTRNAKILSIILIINILDNIRLYLIYPEYKATGYFNTSWFIKEYGNLNFGATSFSYYAMFFALFCFCCISLRKNIIYWVGFIISASYVLFYSGSATIVLSLIVGCVLLLIFNTRSKMRRTIGGIILCCSVIIFLLFGADLLRSFIPFADAYLGEKISVRIEAICQIMDQSSSMVSNVYFARVKYIILDFSTWTRSIVVFLFGKGYHTAISAGGVDYLAELNGDGNHSGLLDPLPRYGLFGVLLIFAVQNGYYYLCSKSSCSQKITIKILYCIFVLNCILNSTLDAGNMLVLFLIYPMMFREEENNGAK